MAEHNLLGEKGEKLAVEFLVKKGYKILETNYRYSKAEVDIIAQQEEVLVVVEVKTRSTDFFGSPEEFVNKKKIQLLTEAIDNYIQDKDLDLEVRFDIIALIKQNNSFSIKHFEDAFLFF